MELLTLSTEYTGFCILGKVEHEREKLQYLNQWMQCYLILDSFLKECKTKLLQSDQMFYKILEIKKDGTLKTKHTKAPTGGKLKWNEKNNRKICELYLKSDLEKFEEIENKGQTYGEWQIKQFPTVDTHTSFYDNQIFASIGEVEKINGNEHYDFTFILSHSLNVKAFPVFNQEINIYISDRLKQIKGQTIVDEFIRKIGELSFAVKIGKIKSPYLIYTEYHGQKSPFVFVGRENGFGQQLEFRKHPEKEWITIFEK